MYTICLEMLGPRKKSPECFRSLFHSEKNCCHQFEIRAYPGWTIRDLADANVSVYGNKYIYQSKSKFKVKNSVIHLPGFWGAGEEESLAMSGGAQVVPARCLL